MDRSGARACFIFQFIASLGRLCAAITMAFSVSTFGRVILCIISVVLVRDSGSSALSRRPPITTSYAVFRNLSPDVDRLFNITVNFSSYHSLDSAFLIHSVNRTQNSTQVKDTFLFRPGSQTRIRAAFRGTYFSVVQCLSKTAERLLEIHLTFNRSATNLVLIMFYSEHFQENSTENVGTKVYESVIGREKDGLVVISLKIGQSDRNEDAVLPHKLIWINCSAFVGHQPRWRPVKLEILDTMTILALTIDNITKETSILTEFSVDDHNALVVCRSMNSSSTRQINIYHHPKEVITEPVIDPRAPIPYNISIRCLAVGGYPPPTATWIMLLGPHNASQYFVRNKRKDIIKITGEAPAGSKWIFKCSVRNQIPPSNPSLLELTTSFNMPELGLEERRKVYIAVPVSIILLLILITAIKAYCYKMKKLLIAKSQNEKHRKKKLNPYSKENILKLLSHERTETTDISSARSSTSYSIEKGLIYQTLFVLDESREEFSDLPIYKTAIQKAQEWIDSTQPENDDTIQ